MFLSSPNTLHMVSTFIQVLPIFNLTIHVSKTNEKSVYQILVKLPSLLTKGELLVLITGVSVYSHDLLTTPTMTVYLWFPHTRFTYFDLSDRIQIRVPVTDRIKDIWRIMSSVHHWILSILMNLNLIRNEEWLYKFICVTVFLTFNLIFSNFDHPISLKRNGLVTNSYW